MSNINLLPKAGINTIVRANNSGGWISDKITSNNIENGLIMPNKIKKTNTTSIDDTLGIRNNKFTKIKNTAGDKRVLIYKNGGIEWSPAGNIIVQTLELGGLASASDGGIILRDTNGNIIFEVNNNEIDLNRRLVMNNLKIINMADGVDPADAVNKKQLDEHLQAETNTNINLNDTYKIINLANGVNISDAINMRQAVSIIRDGAFRNLFITDIYSTSGCAYKSSLRTFDLTNSLNTTLNYLPRYFTVSNGFMVMNLSSSPLFTNNYFQGKDFSIYIKYNCTNHINNSTIFHTYSGGSFIYAYLLNGGGVNLRNIGINVNGNISTSSSNNLKDTDIYNLFITKTIAGNYNLYVYDTNYISMVSITLGYTVIPPTINFYLGTNTLTTPRIIYREFCIFDKVLSINEMQTIMRY